MQRLVDLGRQIALGRAGTWRPRFEFFIGHGLVAAVPDRRQISAATTEMLSFVLDETPIELATNRTRIWGHVPLRVPLQLLYCPQQIVVWNGLCASPRTLVKHLLSSFHEDGVVAYDLQLLQSHPGGLDLLEELATRVAAGEHPLSRLLSAIAGGYHAHLADLARAARRFQYPPDLDSRFSSFVGFANYCLRVDPADLTR